MMERHVWNSEDEVGRFIASLIKMNKAKTVLEVGVFEGETSKHIINAMPKGGYYCGIDVEDFRTDKKVFECKGVAIDFVLEDSKEALLSLNNNYFDVVFVDSAHHWEHILPEFKLVEKVVSENGVIIYHDSIHIPDVSRLMEYARHYGYNVVTLNTTGDRGLSLLRKKLLYL